MPTEDYGIFGPGGAFVESSGGMPHPSSPEVIAVLPAPIRPFRGRPRPKRYINIRGQEIIGLKSATLRHQTIADHNGNLTQDTLDTTSYANGAIIRWINSTGNAQVVVNAAMLGKYVVRLSGENGYIHDEFVDYESIAVDGEILFELGNNFIVDKEQVEKLADFHWKFNRGGKHIYTIDRPGTWFHITPGQWYTLTIGGAGQKEYISATVQCMAVDSSRPAGGLGSTRMMFREVEQNWTFDSNAVARFIAGGSPARFRESESVMVADKAYCGLIDAFSYCDGTADEVEINEAIDYVNAQGGGTVKLTKGGTFYITANDIVFKDDVYIDLNGATIEKNLNDYAMSGGSVDRCGVLGPGTVKVNAADTNAISLMHFVNCDNVTIENVTIGGYHIGTYFQSCNAARVIGNTYRSNCAYDLSFTGCSGAVATENNFTGDSSIVLSIKIRVDTSPGAIISNNTIFSSRTTATNGQLKGILIDDSPGTVVANNMIDTCVSTDESGYGIAVVDALSDGVTIVNNIVRNFSTWEAFATSGAINIGAGVTNTQVKSNTCIDNGNLIDRGNCESATAPLFAGEAVPIATTGGTWAKSTADKYEGSASWLLTKTSAGGAGHAYQYLSDTFLTTDMHGLIAGLTYVLSCYAKAPAVTAIGNYTVVFQERHSGAWNTTKTLTMTETNSWEALVGAALTLNAGTTGIQWYILIDTAEAVNSLFYLDNIRVQPIGIGNDHSQQYSDSGTDTYDLGNSWQGP